MTSTPRKRTRTRSGRPLAFAREDAIESAMQLFWRKGFSGATARDLASAMSIQRSSFYNTFDTREAVFREALRRYSTLAPDAALDDVQPGQPVVALLVSSLREICRVRAADTMARGCLVCNSISELVQVDEALGPMIASAVQARIVKVEGLLRQAEVQGELRVPTDIPGAARSFVAFLVGLNTISKIVRDERHLWATCEAFLAGLGVPREAIDAGRAVGGARPARRKRTGDSHPHEPRSPQARYRGSRG